MFGDVMNPPKWEADTAHGGGRGYSQDIAAREHPTTPRAGVMIHRQGDLLAVENTLQLSGRAADNVAYIRLQKLRLRQDGGRAQVHGRKDNIALL
jgi:hypothetical protein